MWFQNRVPVKTQEVRPLINTAARVLPAPVEGLLKDILAM